MWYCVIRIRDDRLLYLGQDAELARIYAQQEDGHIETAPKRGDAERRCAIAAATMRRQRGANPPPRNFGR